MSDREKNKFYEKPEHKPQVKHWVESQSDTTPSGGVTQAQAGATGILKSIDSKKIEPRLKNQAD